MRDLQNRFVTTDHDIVARAWNLREIAYPELVDRELRVQVKRIRALGNAHWTSVSKPVIITINKEVIGWPDPAVIGLLAHELSHPIVGLRKDTELATDRDVIARGLGVYLAFERAFVGRFLDDPLKRSGDRYLGYSSIRQTLQPHNLKDLDHMLRDFSLIPQRSSHRYMEYPVHDTIGVG